MAASIAAALVERRFAACVNVIPGIGSTYRWQGKVQTDNEVLMLIKTATSQMGAVEQTIKTLSGYELPELVALEIAGGAADYLAWLATSIGETEE